MSENVIGRGSVGGAGVFSQKVRPMNDYVPLSDTSKALVIAD